MEVSWLARRSINEGGLHSSHEFEQINRKLFQSGTHIYYGYTKLSFEVFFGLTFMYGSVNQIS